MNKLSLIGATLAAVGLAIAPTNAQTQSTTTTSSTGYIQSSKIIGSKIRSSDGAEVGVIKDVVLDRSTGCMAYTVLETGDAAGRHCADNHNNDNAQDRGHALDSFRCYERSDRLHNDHSA